MSDKGIERLNSLFAQGKTVYAAKKEMGILISRNFLAMNNGANDAPNHKSHSGLV